MSRLPAHRPRLPGLSDIVAILVLALALVFALTPVLWTALNAVKPGSDIVAFPPVLFFTPTLEHFRTVVAQDLATPLWNTALVTAGAVVVSVTAGSLGGYALSRFRHPLFKTLGFAVFAMRFLPTIAFILPIFMLFNQLGLTGTRLGLVLAYQVFCLPLTIWLTWGFFSQIPFELEEAALIDGCNRFTAFRHVVLPLALPGIGAATVVTTIFSWNQFFIPLILGGRDARVIATEIARYSGAEDAVAQWGALAALSVVIVLPVIVLGFALNRYLIRGLLGRGGE
jgi:multiple sugar transport system permease protein